MKQKSKIQKGLAFVLIMLVMTGAGYLFGKWIAGASGGDNMSPSVVISLLLLIVPLYILALAWHEGGHAVVGKWVGFEFKMYVVGPFSWEKNETGWHFKWNKNINTAGGLVICLPTNTQNIIQKFSWYAAGGPLASLLLAVLAYGAYALFFKGHPAGIVAFDVLGKALLILSFFSLIVFVVTAIPLRGGGFYSDGARIWRMHKGGDAARLEVLTLTLIAKSSSGVRPKDQDMEEMEEAQTIAKRLDDPFGVYMHSFLHQAALDHGDLEKAEKHLLDYIQEAEQIPEGIRNMVWLDAAFFYAFAKKDLERAEDYWKQFKPALMIPKAMVLATEAAMYLLKNEQTLAAINIENAIKELPNVMDKGTAVALKDRLLHMKTIGNESLGLPNP